MAMAAAISQLSCFTSVNRSFRCHCRSVPFGNLRTKFSVAMSLERHDAESSASDMPNRSYTTDLSRSRIEGTERLYSSTEQAVDEKIGSNGAVEQSLTDKKRAAKIHDFCFGIPFGGFIFSSGLLGFMFSKNLTTLGTDVVFGGSLLVLSMSSLKIWKKGKSSLPFILGQAALAAALCWKNFQTYSSMKKIVPSGLYAAISAAMLCFYSYVVISGGNPPPKKLQSAAS